VPKLPVSGEIDLTSAEPVDGHPDVFEVTSSRGQRFAPRVEPVNPCFAELLVGRDDVSKFSGVKRSCHHFGRSRQCQRSSQAGRLNEMATPDLHRLIAV